MFSQVLLRILGCRIYCKIGHILEISLIIRFFAEELDFVCRHTFAIFLQATSADNQSWKAHRFNLLMKFVGLCGFNMVKMSKTPFKLKKSA